VYGGDVSSVEPQGLSDSNYASDMSERRSRTSDVFMINGAAVSWKSHRRQTVALSTTEAEYMALTKATQEATLMRQLVHELHQDSGSPDTIHDSMRTTKVALL
jgi:hypothetical protein